MIDESRTKSEKYLLEQSELYAMPPDKRRRVKKERTKARLRGRPRAHLSVLYWALRSRGLYVGCVLSATVLAEVILFAVRIAGAPNSPEARPYPETFSRMLSGCGIPVVFVTAFLGLTAALMHYGTSGRSRTEYTLGRCMISEFAVRMWQAVFSLGAYFAFAGIQILTAWGLGMWYMATVGANFPAEVGLQTLLFAFYGNDFLHNILPVRDWARWVVTILGWITLSLSAAHVDFAARYKRGWFLSIIGVLFVMWVFTAPMGQPGQDLLVVSPILLLLCIGILIMWKQGGGDRE